METGMTVHEVSALTGVSIRTLQYYDRIGLLPAAGYTEAGYRLYDDRSLERLQMVLLFRELEFPLKDIRDILESPDFDRRRALEQQIELLELKKAHTENLILLAKGMKMLGVKYMENKRPDFSAFDKGKLDEYAAQAKASWGSTPQWQEYEEKVKAGGTEGMKRAGEQMMEEIFGAFGVIKDGDPASEEAQALVKRLQDHITAHFYTCTDEVLRGLGMMYAGGGDMTENIDRAGGEGTAAFAAKAIEAYCGR